jgi:hypothetical protein
MRRKLVMTLAVSALAMTAAGCSLNVQQLLGVQDGSHLDITLSSPIPLTAPPQALEGGTVMNIKIKITLLDLLFGSFKGNIDVKELLIAAPGFIVPLVGPTNQICVVPADPNNPGGGTFNANTFKKTATFDVTTDTLALVGNPTLAALLPGGGFPFPFHLQSSVPFTLADALGLLNGSGNISITQPIDQDLAFNIGPIAAAGHVGGEITLASADAFPTSPLLDSCLALLASQ